MLFSLCAIGYYALAATSARRMLSHIYTDLEANDVYTLLRTANLGSDDTLFVLGSGVGDVPMHAFLETNARKVIGVERMEANHKKADSALTELVSWYPELLTEAFEPTGRLEFRFGDVRDFNTDSLKTATVIMYIAQQNDNTALDKLQELVENITATPNLRAVLVHSKLGVAFNSDIIRRHTKSIVSDAITMYSF